MATQSGVSAEMFGALAEAKINIQMITTSEIKISALVSRDHAMDSLRTVHRAFELDKTPEEASAATEAAGATQNSQACAQERVASNTLLVR